MEQKAKFIIIGLIGVSLIFVFLYLQTLSGKQMVMREKDRLTEENASLTSKVGNLESSLRRSEERLSSINAELQRAISEKDDFARKYELANRAKEELMDKLRAKQTQEIEKPRQEELPQTQEAYWAEVLKSKTNLEMQLESLRNEFKRIRISNDDLQREKSTLELEIKTLTGEKEDLKRQIEYNQKLMDSVAQELVRERNDRMKILESFKSMRNENKLLIRQLNVLNNKKVALEKKIQDLEEDKEAAERKFTEIESMLTAKISQIDELKKQLDGIRSGSATPVQSEDKDSSVKLPPIVVHPSGGEIARGSMVSSSGGMLSSNAREGKVLAVNRENNFVVIDLGENAGVKLGDVFDVFKGNKLIAKIEVIQVRKNISACDIKKQASAINIGDIIK